MKKRQKKTAIAPPRSRRYNTGDPIDAAGEIPVTAFPADSPDWLVGAN